MTTGSSPRDAQTAVFVFADPVRLEPGEALIVELRQRSLRGHSNIQRFRLELSNEVGPGARALAETPREQLAALIRAGGGSPTNPAIPGSLRKALQAELLAEDFGVQQLVRSVEQARIRHRGYESAAKPQNVMVLRDRAEARQTYVLQRGVWDRHGPAVTAGVPAALGPGEANTRTTRLDLARWLVHRSNPLTARVAVNRYWQMYFGHGLVRTPADFGSQGQAPDNQALLDWLAVEFMESGWNVRHMQKLIVTSATYRQSSVVTPELRERDPRPRRAV